MTGEGSLRPATCNGQAQGNERGTYTHYTSHERQCGIAYKRRLCAASRTMVFLAQPGGTERHVLGSTADPMGKPKRDNSLLLKR